MKQTARLGLLTALIVTVLVCTMSGCNSDTRQGPSDTDSKIVNFMVIADIHHGYLKDVTKRLQIFIDQAEQEAHVDFIIQLGDFILDPTESKSGDFLKLWNSFKGPRYHVLGNHDMDLADKARVRAFWGMPANYYSFDLKGFRFIVLDANTKAGFGKVILSLNGHGHSDLSEVIKDVPYVEIPTAAHKWDGKPIPYTTVRFAVVSLDPKGAVKIDARSVEFDYQDKGKGDFAEGNMLDKSFSFVPKPRKIYN